MTRAAHLVRPAARRPKAAAPAPTSAFKPGHFTELIRLHNWPPRFESRLPASSGPDWSAISTENREKRVAMGDTGTIVGLSRKGPKEGAPARAAVSLGVRRA